MKIKISKNYHLCHDLYKSDIERTGQRETFTNSISYSPTWETVDVTLEQLEEYVKAGYPIKIIFRFLNFSYI